MMYARLLLFHTQSKVVENTSVAMIYIDLQIIPIENNILVVILYGII